MEEIFLSDELMFEILFNIPVKTLFRFKCVCKRWRRLISDPTFLKRWRSVPPLISGFYYYYYRKETEVVGKLKFHPCQANPTNLDIDSNLHFLTRSASVVASHNGILLCVEEYPRYEKLVVCNPFTKQWIALPEHLAYPLKNIPMSLYCYRKKESISESSIDFSEEGIEFKVVIHPASYPANVKVFHTYSSETSEWKTSRFSDSHAIYLVHMALIRGSAFLWGSYNHFCIYDFKNETISFKELPGIDDRYCSSVLMEESAESVYCIRYKATGICMWELNGNNQWTKVHEVSANSFKNHLPPDYGFAVSHVLRYLPVDRKLLLRRYGRVGILLYDMGTRQIQHVENLNPNIEFPFVPYSLPAWPLCLKGT